MDISLFLSFLSVTAIIVFSLMSLHAFRSPFGLKVSVSTVSAAGLFGLGSLFASKGCRALTD